ncbi:stealth family protein [Streptomyces sp. YIM 98790]|uniref:stealth family protein n=1 Tax=Streptomyces sp. YIM 98790 TaxID=2689077 RepID=UPI001408B26C|nr:stealth family protein [Streptomyces sp. YIM 98790]
MTVRAAVRRLAPRAIRKGTDQVWRLRTTRRRLVRRRAAAADPRMRRIVVGGQELYGLAVDRFSSAEAAGTNLGIVLSALERAGAASFLVPGMNRLRHTVGVHLADRDRFFDALQAAPAADGPVFVAQPRFGGRLQRPALCLDGRLPVPLRSAPVVRVGVLYLGPGGQLLGGPELGCDVEFWSDGADLLAGPQGERELARVQPQASREIFAEALVAPRRNRIADVLPSAEQTPAVVRAGGRDVTTFAPFTVPTVDQVTAGGRDVTTFAPFTVPTVDQVTFPVDVVYTWVDGNEPGMRAKRARYQGRGTADILDKEINESRYTSHDELRYSLRSLHMYAGFVRHIYLVTDGQRPAWLDEDAAGITVVDHREIFPGGTLPVFNSHAIETRLHHIPGLSDHYLYFNDDVFVGRPVLPEHFFLGSGVMKVPVSPLKIGAGKPHAEETATNSASKNVRRLLLDRFGRLTTNNFMHTPLPQQRATLAELEEMFPEEIRRTTASRFRSPQDVALTSPLLYQYALLTGRGVPGRFSFRYVNISREDAGQRLDDLLSGRRYDFFCLNDVDVPPDRREEVTARVAAFLADYFPCPSPYEKA